MAFEHIWDEKQRQRKLKAEQKRITEAFGAIPDDKLSLAQGLIESASFQRVMMMELELILKRDGYIETYQNGENQKGYKKSSAVEVYDKTCNTYAKVVKQLCDLLPSDASAPGAEIMEFIRRR